MGKLVGLCLAGAVCGAGLMYGFQALTSSSESVNSFGELTGGPFSSGPASGQTEGARLSGAEPTLPGGAPGVGKTGVFADRGVVSSGGGSRGDAESRIGRGTASDGLDAESVRTAQSAFRGDSTSAFAGDRAVASDPATGRAVASGPGGLPPPSPRWENPNVGPGGLGTSANSSGPAARISDGSLEEAKRLARGHYNRGEHDQAKRLWRGVFRQARDRADQDLTGEVRVLLSIDDDPYSRREYLSYLRLRNLGDVAFSEQLAQAGILAASNSPDDLRRAWAELDIAYDIASSIAQRSKVKSQLDPMVDRLILSGRRSPLLERYQVRAGDNLSSIAARSDTTVDAIKRLNALSTDQIQPRMTLNVLSGRVAIFVDKSDFRLWVTVDDRVLREFPVGLGRENRTPLGQFVVRVRQKDPIWYPNGEPAIAAGDPRNVLGTRWLGFADTDENSGIGIHGTRNRGDLGGESSAGCIRMVTPDVELLYDLAPRGTVVTIQE